MEGPPTMEANMKRKTCFFAVVPLTNIGKAATCLTERRKKGKLRYGKGRKPLYTVNLCLDNTKYKNIYWIYRIVPRK
jgi:hypothetical protein